MTTKLADKHSTDQNTDVKQPPKYKVVIHNDDDTPVDFVIHVLQRVFHHTPEAAAQLTMEIHKAGKGVAGVYTREVAETKAALTVMLASKKQYPLLSTIEQE